MMIILGSGGILGDAASAILKEGELAAAIEESKLTRRSSNGDLPQESIRTCLALAGVKPEQVDCVAIVRPLSSSTEGAMHLQLRAGFPNSRIAVLEHHTAHAASAYYASPFDEATVLTLDRAGDFRAGSLWRGIGNHLTLEKEIYYPDSLGDLYGRVTELLGFQANADEHKVQWLSVSADESRRDLFLEMMPRRDGEWLHIDRSFFSTERLTRGGFGPKFFERLGLEHG